jgi:hypothetical protein
MRCVGLFIGVLDFTYRPLPDAQLLVPQGFGDDFAAAKF